MANAVAGPNTEGLIIQETAPNLVDMPAATDIPLATATNTIADWRTQRAALVRWVALGAFGGLAWGAALRALMTLFVLQFGERPHFTWYGTYVVILLPAALMGALLGAAAHLTTSSGEKRWRWAILSPLLLLLFPLLLLDDFILALTTTGLGGGAVYVALMGVLGGYAFSDRGRGWMRWGWGILNVGLLIAATVAGSGTAGLPSADAVFTMLYFGLLLTVLSAGVSAPSHLGEVKRKTVPTDKVTDKGMLSAGSQSNNGGNHEKQ